MKSSRISKKRMSYKALYFKKGKDHPAKAGWMKPIQQFAPKAGTKRNRVPPRVFGVGIYLGLAGLVVASSLGKLILANHLATAGEEITQLEERVTQLESGSHTLRNEIAGHSSLRSVLESALELGMVSGGGRVDILGPASLASR